MTTAAAILLVALVAEDPAILRNAPRDDAPAEASLWRGDWLEVRGEAAGFLRVYDHRRERAGYVRPAQVRIYRTDEATAPELAAVVRFLRDAPGFESLGIGHAALALRAAPPGADTSELLGAIATMADRLARRASARKRDTRDVTLAAHLEVAESYGVKFKIVDGGGDLEAEAAPAHHVQRALDADERRQLGLRTARALRQDPRELVLDLGGERHRYTASASAVASFARS